jgi:hypothetical protein
VPTRGQVIATEPLDELLFEVPHYGRHGFDYWHQRLDGRIVAGGFRDVSLDSEFTADEVTTAVVQDALGRFVEGLAGRPLRVDYRWAGIFGMVFDFLPVVGRVPGEDGLWMAGGYSGHGNVLGFACGRLVAGALLGEDDPKLALFDPARLLVTLVVDATSVRTSSAACSSVRPPSLHSARHDSNFSARRISALTFARLRPRSRRPSRSTECASSSRAWKARKRCSTAGTRCSSRIRLSSIEPALRYQV